MRTSLSALPEELHFLDSPSATLQLETVPGFHQKALPGQNTRIAVLLKSRHSGGNRSPENF